MTANDLFIALPELFILGMACLIMLIDLYLPENRRGMVCFVSVMSLLFAGIMVMRWQVADAATVQYAFNGTFVRDSMADVLKLFCFIVLAAVFIYAKHYMRIFNLFRGEYYVLSLFLLLGAMVLISAASLLTVYLGLELISLSSYALVALDRDSRRGSEAAMKYFILGSLASGLLLYGLSMIYGVTGSLSLENIAATVAIAHNNMVLVFGLFALGCSSL